MRNALLLVALLMAPAAPAQAQSLDNTTILYTVPGLSGGSFKVYFARSGNIYETNLSGGGGPSGAHYQLGRTLTETVKSTDVTGGSLTCTTRSRASITGRTIHLQADMDCKFAMSFLDGKFTHKSTIRIDGNSCSVTRASQNLKMGAASSGTSSSCSIQRGNLIGAPAS
jgi:hypothetical protein